MSPRRPSRAASQAKEGDAAVPLFLRVPADLAERIKAAAAADNRSLNTWCVLALQDAVDCLKLAGFESKPKRGRR